MCIAIPPPLRERGRPPPLWWRRVAARPLSLLGLGAGIQAVGAVVTLPGPALPLALAVLALAMGAALERVAALTRAQPASYPLYGGLFFLTTGAGLLASAGAGLGSRAMTLAGGGLALLALILLFRSLGWMFTWARGPVPPAARLWAGAPGVVALAVAALLA